MVASVNGAQLFAKDPNGNLVPVAADGDAIKTVDQNGYPVDRHESNSGVGVNTGDTLFQTTDSTGHNEHIIEVTAGAIDLAAKANSDSPAYTDYYVENLNVANPGGAQITGVGLGVGRYRLRGKFHSIRAQQNGATAATAYMTSYVK